MDGVGLFIDLVLVAVTGALLVDRIGDRDKDEGPKGPKAKFMKCMPCSLKPGKEPTLCPACLHNKALIEGLQR